MYTGYGTIQYVRSGFIQAVPLPGMVMQPMALGDMQAPPPPKASNSLPGGGLQSTLEVVFLSRP